MPRRTPFREAVILENALKDLLHGGSLITSCVRFFRKMLNFLATESPGQVQYSSKELKD